MKRITSVAIMGMGYVGLTLSVVLAKRGFRVYGIEVNKDVVAQLRKGIPHFQERGLAQILTQEQRTGTLSIHEKLPDEPIDAYVISVGTPLIKGEKRPNIDYIKGVLRDVGGHLKPGGLVILRSTVPVGLSRNLAIPTLESVSKLKVGKEFSFVFAPERTIEGKAIIELETNSQVIGGYDEQSVTVATDMFRRITPTIVVVSSIEGAEMVKLMDNSYRDVRFAYANEIAMICERFGLDATELVHAANTHYPRNNIPVPSPGVGGACLSKDPHILYNVASEHGYAPELLRRARDINEQVPHLIVERVQRALQERGKDLRSAKVFVVGFAFKGQPETSDLRDSTTLWCTHELGKYAKRIYGYDPVIKGEELIAHKITPVTMEEGFANADVVLFLNNHQSYLSLDTYALCARMNAPAILYDGWRMFEKKSIEETSGITYMGVGA